MKTRTIAALVLIAHQVHAWSSDPRKVIKPHGSAPKDTSVVLNYWAASAESNYYGGLDIYAILSKVIDRSNASVVNLRNLLSLPKWSEKTGFDICVDNAGTASMLSIPTVKGATPSPAELNRNASNIHFFSSYFSKCISGTIHPFNDGRPRIITITGEDSLKITRIKSTTAIRISKIIDTANDNTRAVFESINATIFDAAKSCYSANHSEIRITMLAKIDSSGKASYLQLNTDIPANSGFYATILDKMKSFTFLARTSPGIYEYSAMIPTTIQSDFEIPPYVLIHFQAPIIR